MAVKLSDLPVELSPTASHKLVAAHGAVIEISALPLAGNITVAASQVTNDSSVTGAKVKDALNTLLSIKQAFSAILESITNLSATGIISRTGSGAVAARTLTSGEGINISNPAGVAGNPVIGVNISGLSQDNAPDSATDYVVTYDVSAAAHKKVLLANLPGGTSPSASQVNNDSAVSGAKVSDALNSLSTGKQAASSSLSSVAALASTGLVTRTGSGTFTERTVVGGTDVTVTNGNGVAGNPTVALPSAINANARVAVKQNGVGVSTRRSINLVAGAGISLGVTDDSGNEAANVTITSTSGGGGQLISSLADDTPHTIVLPTNQSSGLLFVEIAGQPNYWGMVFFETAGTLTATKISGGANMEVAVAELTGTTGADGNLTVGVQSGALIVENRTGTARNVRVTFVSNTL